MNGMYGKNVKDQPRGTVYMTEKVTIPRGWVLKRFTTFLMVAIFITYYK